jgi:hypothetical protein
VFTRSEGAIPNAQAPVLILIPSASQYCRAADDQVSILDCSVVCRAPSWSLCLPSRAETFSVAIAAAVDAASSHPYQPSSTGHALVISSSSISVSRR